MSISSRGPSATDRHRGMFPPSHPSRRRLSLVAAAAATSLLATGLVLQNGTAQAQPERPAGPVDPQVTHRVTLITGDVVTVTTLADGKEIADVDRPDNAVGGVRMQEAGGDLFVVPDEAVSLLGANKLDRRLFNVTDLIEMGYDDASVGTVPMIATFKVTRTLSAAAPTAPRASTMVRRLPAVHGAALTTRKQKARTFWTSLAPRRSASDRTPTLGEGVAKLWLDGRVEPALKESVPQIGAPEAWAAGYDGKGVTVAVLDTGIDANHPDLEDQIDGTASFVPGETITDVNGHGTHVASTIVGTGAASNGDYKGVAPGADLIVGKVLGGSEGYGQDSWVLAGMEWAARSGADVISMSLGDSMPSDGTDPMSQAVDSLSEQYGSLFVIAAGNAGPESISTPGAAASALTVGAVDKQDSLAYFSSTGPLTGSGALKPDIVAPGVDITAARSQEMTDGGSGMYRTLSGTSMATPHVAGAAAILAQRHPAWSGQQLKDQLMSSARGLADWYSPYEVGTGRVDVFAAISRTVRATPSLFLGNYDWPHEPGDVAVTKDLTFTNDGDQEVTLDLTLTGDAFTLGADTVTVPAGGTASVPVTGDPQAVDFGRHAGFVVATDASTGEPVTRTSVALLKEDERYNLTVKLVDRNGDPASGWVGFAMAGDFWPWAEYVDGEKTLRMPRGTYTLSTYMDVTGEKADRSGLAVLVDPETVLDSSTEVVLDARDARLLETEAPQRSEDRQRKVDFGIVDRFGVEIRGAYAVWPGTDDVYVSPTEPMTEGEFILTTRWRKGERALDLSSPDGKSTFDTMVQAGSDLSTATRMLPTAYAGQGAAADYARVNARGKIVVVRRSDDVSPSERAAAAAAAGAKALIVVNDGVGGLSEYVGESSIAVASVHRDQGSKLIALAKAGRKLTMAQAKYPSFVYDLTREYPGQVPDHALVYKPSQGDLARIDARYYGVRGGEASGYRYDLTLTPSLGFHEREWHPGTRVEWVTPGQVWVESHAQNIYAQLPWEMVSGVNTFKAGQTTRLDWFRPAVRPGFSDSFGVINSRWQNYMTWNVQPWSSSSDVMALGGYLPWGETPTHLQVFQGETLIHDNPYSADMQWIEVPAGNLPYRAVLDAERPADIFRLSTRTHTEWTFMSDSNESDFFEPFTVMQLDYQLETDLHGDLEAGAKHEMAIRPIPSDFGTLPGSVTQVSFKVSYDDGASWHNVTLAKGADGWWRGSFKPTKAGSFLSVRASADMDSGYSIEQEIIRAYGLR
jgi:subtilisin family serine protease